MAALALILSAGGYGWVMNANDFSRYLPPELQPAQDRLVGGARRLHPDRRCCCCSAPRWPPRCPGRRDPIRGLPHAFARLVLWPYLVFVIVQLFAINSVDLYSSGLTLQAIIPAIKRWQCVLIDTTVAGALTAVAVFSSSFNTFITDFLLFMIIWIAPWVAIYLVDCFMRRGRYDSRSLLSGRAGIYWRNGGSTSRASWPS